MSEGSVPGMCSNAGNDRATDAILVDKATKTLTVPPEQAIQPAKNDPASSPPRQRPGESEEAPSRQDLKDPEPTRNSEPMNRPLERAKDLRALNQAEGSIKTQNPLSPKQPKQSEGKPESVLTHVFYEGTKDDVLSCDVVAIYIGSNHPGDDNGLSVFQRNTKPVRQSPKDGDRSAENRKEPPRNLGTQSDGASKKPAADNRTTIGGTRTWLGDSDMLHKALPSSRIMSFGWNIVAQMTQNKHALGLDMAASQILKMLLEKRTEQQRSRPIIFIGHGYGNVIIEKMLFEELHDTKELEGGRNAVVASTTAIILFAPPFSNFDKLIEWLHRTFKGSEKVTTGEHLPSTGIWNTFFSQTGKHDIATFAFVQTSTMAITKGKHPEKGFENLDSKWKLDADIENIAWVPDFDNEHFKNICKVISQSTIAHQLIQAGEAPDVPKIETLIDKMIERHIDFNSEIRRGQPILHIAADRRLKILVRCLVDRGVVALDGQDNEGNTALHVAVQKDAFEIVQDLMERGADWRIKNKAKKSVLKLARKSENVLPQIRSLIDNPPILKGPPERRKLVQGKPRNKDAKRACTETGITVWEIFESTDKDFDEYRCIPSTIQRMIYEKGPIDDLFQISPTPSEKILCRWHHVPTNNMAWVHDLFAKLGAEVWPWPSEFKRGRFHHGRCMNPEASRLERLQKGSRQDSTEDWVIFGSKSQKKIAELIGETSSESAIRNVLWEDLTEELYRSFEDFISKREQQKGKDKMEETDGDDKTKKKERGAEQESKQNENDENREKKKDEWQGDAAHDDVVGDRPDENLTDEDETDGKDSEGEVSNGEESDEDSAETLTIKGYLNGRNRDKTAHLAFHIRRTLDQAYYYMLKDTSYRDKMQVVSRWAQRTWPEKNDHNIIMVDQLWLWLLKGTGGEPDTVITSFPPRQGAKFDQEHDASDWNTSFERDNIERMILMGKGRDSIRQTTDLVSRILSVCCNSFNPHEHLEPVNFLQSFESTIGNLEEDESRLFRLFRERAKILHGLHDRHRFYSQDRSVLLKKLLDIRQESKLLKEVKDILDEIKMIKSVLEHQIEAVGSLQRIVSETTSPNTNQALENDQGPFGRVFTMIRNTKRKFDGMESHAKEVEFELNRLFDLKQKQANLWEARFAREGAEEASKQGSTVLVFTIVTIIFLPLSFMASFFALGISIFPRQDGENYFELSWVSGILFGVSFAVSVPFVIIALKIDFVANIWSKLKHTTAKYLAFKILKPYANKNNRRVLLWYRRAVKFIAKHDLPYDTKDEVDKRLRDKVGPDQSSSKLGVSSMGEGNEEYTDTEEELTDKDEQEVKERQEKRQQDLLHRIEAEM